MRHVKMKILEAFIRPLALRNSSLPSTAEFELNQYCLKLFEFVESGDFGEFQLHGNCNVVILCIF